MNIFQSLLRLKVLKHLKNTKAFLTVGNLQLALANTGLFMCQRKVIL